MMIATDCDDGDNINEATMAVTMAVTTAAAAHTLNVSLLFSLGSATMEIESKKKKKKNPQQSILKSTHTVRSENKTLTHNNSATSEMWRKITRKKK